ncbi:MAG: M20/M25/M40 family metallo-hydrolase, partial [Planctomycetes bacterium]|nr:M20/M25/M40 family metallo-hydrolase [Planctomycetota bacterium]
MTYANDAHRQATEMLARIIATPSKTGDEAAVVDLIVDELAKLGLKAERHERNLVVTLTKGEGPTLYLNTHMDTVPAAAGYTRDPFAPDIEDGKLYGLGSNDAGAALVSMALATHQLAQREDWQGTLKLLYVVEEEVSGRNGAEKLVAEIGLGDAAIVGEPTALNICIAQKGLIVMDAVNRGLSCHAANAYRVEHKNAILEALEDANAVHALTFAESDTYLGPTTLNVTKIKGGTATNSIPDLCEWAIDARINPAQTLEGVLEAVRQATKAEVNPRSLRLHPLRTDPSQAVVRAAQAARPASELFGSDTMSDAVFFRAGPVIKCGPGITEMSHKPDEYVELRW